MKRIYANTDGSAITDESQLASNAALYADIVTAFNNDELPPQIVFVIVVNDYKVFLNSWFIVTDGSSFVGLSYWYGDVQYRITLLPDGTTNVE